MAAEFDRSEVVICTLKDAVKLAPVWPRLAPPLWYVSQQVMVERGVGGLERVLDDLVRVRSGTSPTAG
jgi:tetraacyldisaccharide 4'-kinase